MRTHSPIWYFALVFGACYTLLALVPWPSLPARYATAYCYVAQPLFGSYGERGVVTFVPIDHPNRTADTVITTKLRGSRYSGDVTVSAWVTAYLPTVEFIALALATPIVWRRRLIGLGIGVVVIQAMIAVRILTALCYWFSTPNTPWRVHELSDWVRSTLALLNESINEAPVVSFVLPAIVWLMIMFRPADWGGVFSFQEAEGPDAEATGRPKSKPARK